MRQSDDFNAIAQRIKQRRMELNLSLQDVADMTEMSKSTLQRYESGSIRNIPLQKLGVLASALQTSADWILGWCKVPDDIPPIDVDFRKFIRALGFRVKAWPGYQSRIYLQSDGIGQAQITKAEYEQFRDSISAYVKFNASNLLKQAMDREEEQIRTDLDHMDEVSKSLELTRDEKK